MMNSKRGRFVSLAAAAATAIALALVLAPGASAQEGAEGQETGEVPQDTLPPGEWVKRCSERDNGMFCEISFGRFVQIQDNRVWLARAGIFEFGDRRDLFIFTPLGAELRRGILYRIDTAEPKPAQFSVCLQLQGCQALASIDQAAIDTMKSGSQLQVQFTMANQPPLITAVSLAGFTAAYDGPPAEMIEAAPAAAGAGAGEAAGGGAGGGGADESTSGKGDAPSE